MEGVVQMVPVKLGDKVRIREISIIGKVVGVWSSLYGQTQYHVRYYDDTKSRSTIWFVESDIEVVE